MCQEGYRNMQHTISIIIPHSVAVDSGDGIWSDSYGSFQHQTAAPSDMWWHIEPGQTCATSWDLHNTTHVPHEHHPTTTWHFIAKKETALTSRTCVWQGHHLGISSRVVDLVCQSPHCFYTQHITKFVAQYLTNIKNKQRHNSVTVHTDQQNQPSGVLACTWKPSELVISKRRWGPSLDGGGRSLNASVWLLIAADTDSMTSSSCSAVGSCWCCECIMGWARTWGPLWYTKQHTIHTLHTLQTVY